MSIAKQLSDNGKAGGAAIKKLIRAGKLPKDYYARIARKGWQKRRKEAAAKPAAKKRR